MSEYTIEGKLEHCNTLENAYYFFRQNFHPLDMKIFLAFLTEHEECRGKNAKIAVAILGSMIKQYEDERKEPYY